MKSAASGIFVFIGAGLISGCGMNVKPDNPETVYSIVSELGYVATRPPSKLLGPGSIVRIKSKSPLSASLVCTAEGALGADIPMGDSATVTEKWKNDTSGGINLGGGFTEKINANLGGSFVTDIDVTLDNAEVFALVDQTVVSRAKKGSTSEGCQGAVKANAEAGRQMTMIRSALQANVTYTITFSRKVSASEKDKYLTKIAPELSGNYERKGSDTITGKDLYFGVIDDPFLITLLTQSEPGMVAAPAPRRDMPVAPVLGTGGSHIEIDEKPPVE